jgi:hypothetical protein
MTDRAPLGYLYYISVISIYKYFAMIDTYTLLLTLPLSFVLLGIQEAIIGKRAKTPSFSYGDVSGRGFSRLGAIPLL